MDDHPEILSQRRLDFFVLLLKTVLSEACKSRCLSCRMVEVFEPFGTAVVKRKKNLSQAFIPHMCHHSKRRSRNVKM